MAGWVGLLITSLNLLPIGQLDGGHILYAILGRRARLVATLVLIGCVIGVIVYSYYWWSLMLVLLLVFGPAHPPTQRDNLPLGWWRTIVGTCLLAFVIIGFTPNLLPRHEPSPRQPPRIPQAAPEINTAPPERAGKLLSGPDSPNVSIFVARTF
jgi:membrane-associated protease RseP (regulator of RpoE activity)